MNPQPAPAAPLPGAKAALGLLLAINLFNYIDRQVLSAVIPKLRDDASLFRPDEGYRNFKVGTLATAFMVSYMLFSPVFGRFGDRGWRWAIIGLAVAVWSLASGASGLATSFWMLLATRCLVGIGEAAYGPIAPAMLSDLYPVESRGRVITFFYVAIPVGSALGYLVGGQIGAAYGWRNAFLATVVPGLALGAACFLMRDPSRPARAEAGGRGGYGEAVREFFRIRSFRYTTVGMTCSTFVLGGVGLWMPTLVYERQAELQITEQGVAELAGLTMANSDGVPVVPPGVIAKLNSAAPSGRMDYDRAKAEFEGLIGPEDFARYQEYIKEHLTAEGSPGLGQINLIFGAILVVGGLSATLFGGWLGDRLRSRHPGSYFLVSGVGMLVGLPFFVAMLYLPFPLAWGAIFVAVFCLFANTGPMNTVLANVTRPETRASAFALNILVIHALGDVISPVIIGGIADVASLRAGFLAVSGLIAASGLIWCLGARHLAADTARASAA